MMRSKVHNLMLKAFQNYISKRQPIFLEESRLPIVLSKVSPIEISALSFACFVFSRGKINKTTRRHETIHYHQQIELSFVIQWILYGLFWTFGMIKYRNGKKAYYENPFEREAYANERKTTYLEKRPLWNWVNYIKVEEV